MTTFVLGCGGVRNRSTGVTKDRINVFGVHWDLELVFVGRACYFTYS